MISPLCGSNAHLCCTIFFVDYIRPYFFCWFISQELTRSLFLKTAASRKDRALERGHWEEGAGWICRFFFPIKHGGQVIESPCNPSIWSFFEPWNHPFWLSNVVQQLLIHKSEFQPRKWCSSGKWLSHFVIQDKNVSSPNVGNTWKYYILWLFNIGHGIDGHRRPIYRWFTY